VPAVGQFSLPSSELTAQLGDAVNAKWASRPFDAASSWFQAWRRVSRT
jgi:hypothetical protein